MLAFICRCLKIMRRKHFLPLFSNIYMVLPILRTCLFAINPTYASRKRDEHIKLIPIRKHVTPTYLRWCRKPPQTPISSSAHIATEYAHTYSPKCARTRLGASAYIYLQRDTFDIYDKYPSRAVGETICVWRYYIYIYIYHKVEWGGVGKRAHLRNLIFFWVRSTYFCVWRRRASASLGLR